MYWWNEVNHETPMLSNLECYVKLVDAVSFCNGLHGIIYRLTTKLVVLQAAIAFLNGHPQHCKKIFKYSLTNLTIFSYQNHTITNISKPVLWDQSPTHSCLTKCGLVIASNACQNYSTEETKRHPSNVWKIKQSTHARSERQADESKRNPSDVA